MNDGHGHRPDQAGAPLTLAELLPGRALPAIVIRGVAENTADVRPGDLFAGLPGGRVHGAYFADAAIRAGAVALLTDHAGLRCLSDVTVPVAVVDHPQAILGPLAARVAGRPADGMRIIGVTGTNGKTTVTWLVRAGLAAAGIPTATLGTLGCNFAGQTLPLGYTTPPAPVLQRTLADLRTRGAQAVAMEVSSHALASHRVDGTTMAVAAFTNLSRDHLDFHGTMEAYFAAKRRLFTRDFTARAIVAVDDVWGQRLAGMISEELACTTVSLRDPRADWTIAGQRLGPQGSTAELIGPGGSLAVSIAMPGAVNLANALVAAAILTDLAVPATSIVAGLASARVPGRMAQVTVPGAPLGIVDYAHTPHAIEAVCSSMRAVLPAQSRLIVVIGAGGERDTGKRQGMGAAAASHADIVVVTDDNPRGEDPAAIRAQVLAGTEILASCAHRVEEIAGRAAAIARAVALAAPEDLVLVLGKGHETGQEVAGRQLEFDDQQVLAEALAGAIGRAKRAGG